MRMILKSQKFEYNRKIWYDIFVNPVSSYGIPQFGHCDDFTILNYAIENQNFMFVSFPVLQKIQKIVFYPNNAIIDKTIELPIASSPHGITLSKYYLYVCLNDISSIYIYKLKTYSLHKKVVFPFPIMCHIMYTFDDINLYVVDEDGELYLYNIMNLSIQKLTNNFFIAEMSALPQNNLFVTNVQTTNKMMCLNRNAETGILLIEQNKNPIFIPFVCSFQKLGIQGVHVTSDLVYVCFLTAGVFGYIDFKTQINVAFQTRCQIFHFIDLRYCEKYDILFLLSTTIVPNSCDALVYVPDFKKKFSFQNEHKEFTLQRGRDYKYIMFANVSLHRISFLYNQEKIVISQTRSGKIAYFDTNSFVT